MPPVCGDVAVIHFGGRPRRLCPPLARRSKTTIASSSRSLLPQLGKHSDYVHESDDNSSLEKEQLAFRVQALGAERRTADADWAVLGGFSGSQHSFPVLAAGNRS